MHQRRRDFRLLQTARVFADSGTCSRLHTGAVVARDGRILVTGYNGAPTGVEHCYHENPSSTDPKDACRIAVHAEQNCVAFAARHGVALEGAEIVCTHQPCMSCAQSIINAGIRRVLYEQPYRDISGVTMLERVGIRVEAWLGGV